MPFLDELAAQIVAAGAGTIGVDLFMSTKAQIPSGPGPYTVLIETGGTTSRRTQNDNSTERPSAQISVRATSYTIARQRAVQVYNAFGGDNGLFNTYVGGTRYVSIIPLQSITDLGLDELSRARVGYNIDAEKDPS